ncbi:MAG: response regulator [Chloroherpetonaceae bacterium]
MSDKPEILLIDDEPLVLDSLKILFKRDYKVLTAESGEQGINELRKHPDVKVVISDQRMPGLLGHETLREIKKINPHSIRILLTGYSDLEAILNSVNSGEVFRYINKPWDSTRLTQVVQLGIQINTQLEKVSREAAHKRAELDAVVNHASPHKNSLLFVDEHIDAVQQLVNQFSGKYNCAGVSSTDDALRELSKRPISVVVSNTNFSEADPIDFLSAISHEYPNTVTLIYTEQRDATLAIRAINELNVFRYLVKPTDDARLIESIETAMQRNKAREQKLEASAIHIGREVAPETNEVSALRKKIEMSPYLLKLRAMRVA